ncbi:MAG: hypothetical protein ACD_64C00002G0001, partial [uncultured bacterium]
MLGTILGQNPSIVDHFGQILPYKRRTLPADD